MTRGLPSILVTTLSSALIGWFAAAVLLVQTIPECGWSLIRSGIVRDEVWINHIVVAFFSTAFALSWAVCFAIWLNRRGSRGGVLAALLCVGYGATAWIVPALGLDFTLFDHWESGIPFAGAPPLESGACGLSADPIGTALGVLGIAAMVGWSGYAVMTRPRS